MAKAEIGWERKLEDGTTRQVYVHHTGGQYRFFAREKRFDEWEAVKEAPVEDWLALLDCVRRRIQRRKMMPVDEKRVLNCIRDRFPDAKV